MMSALKPASLKLCKETIACSSLLHSRHRIRHFSTTTDEYDAGPDDEHSFLRMNQWNNRTKLIHHFIKSLIYNKDGLVILNKPWGVGSSAKSPSIYQVLPYISEKLGYKELNIIKVPERYTSGITVLAAGEKRGASVSLSIRRAKSLPHCAQTYWAVTVGQPYTQQSFGQYAIGKQVKPGLPPKSVIFRKWGKNQVKRREVAVGFISHNVLNQNELASLLAVSTFLVRHHCPRIYLSDVQLSPVLGDSEFGSRVSEVLGKKILVNPFTASGVVHLSKPLRKAINIRAGEEHLLPLHLHLHELRLVSYCGGKKDLVVQAEPPRHFKWSCHKLGLTVPETIPWKVEDALSPQPRSQSDSAANEAELVQQ